MDIEVQIRNSNAERFAVKVGQSSEGITITTSLAAGSVHAALQDAFEIRISLAALRAKPGSQLFLRVEAWSDKLPVGSLPYYGEVELQQTAMAAYSF